MYNNEKIGVGIVTYNRKESYNRLINIVKSNSDIDYTVTVKNKNIDYGEFDPSIHSNNNIFHFNVIEDLGVGYCKNICIKTLLKHECDHIFLIEDDINIKNPEVFKQYINTAKAYRLQHLNFCMAWDSITKKYLMPSYSLQNNDGVKLSIFDRLCGDFEYFTANVIQQVGLFDAKHYINALEHAEHTYRIAMSGYTTPFNAFADIYNSTEYIEDIGIESSIHHDQQSQELYRQRIRLATYHFNMMYGRSIGQLPHPTANDIKTYLNNN